MHTYSNKCPTEFEPSRHRSKPSPVIRPARARLPRFARGSFAKLCQIQLRSHGADGACPSRGRSTAISTVRTLLNSPIASLDADTTPRRSRFAELARALPGEARRCPCPPTGLPTPLRRTTPRAPTRVGTAFIPSRRARSPVSIVIRASPRVSPVSPAPPPPHSPRRETFAETKIVAVSGVSKDLIILIGTGAGPCRRRRR